MISRMALAVIPEEALCPRLAFFGEGTEVGSGGVVAPQKARVGLVAKGGSVNYSPAT